MRSIYLERTALAASLMAMPAMAQEKPLAAPPASTQDNASGATITDDIVVTARYSGYSKPVAETALKVPVPLKDLPQAATVITSDFLRDINATRLMEVLPYIAGAQRTDTGFAGSSQAKLRGQYIVAPNGVKLDGGAVQIEASVDSAILDSIEILKGPVASLYGRGPGVGVINYLTKRPFDTFAVRTELEVGSYEHARGVLDVNLPIASSTTSRFILYGSHDDNNVNLTNAHTFGAYATVEVAVTDTTKITVTESFKNFHNDRPSYRTTFFDPAGNIVLPYFLKRDAYVGASNSYINYNDNLISTKLDKQIGEHMSAVVRASYDYYDRNTLFGAVFADPDPLVKGRPYNVADQYSYVFFQNRRYKSANAEINLVRRVDEGSFRGSSLLLGASYDDTVAQNRQRAVSTPDPDGTFVITPDGHDFGPLTIVGPPVLRSDDSMIGKGVFAQVVLRHAGFTFLSSGRYDWYDAHDRLRGARQADTQFSYRVGLSYELTPSLNVFAGYGTGFNPQGNLALDGTYLPSETDKNVEAGVKYSSADHRANFSVVAFHNKKFNTALALPPPTDSFFVPNGTQVFKGLEADAQLSPVRGLDLLVAATYLDAKLESGQRPGTYAKYIASAFARYGIPAGRLKGFNVSAGVTYTSRSTINDPASDFSGLNRVAYASPYALVQAGIGYHGLRIGDFNLTVSNLLDQRYFIGNGFLTGNVQDGDPRSVTLSLRSKF